MAEDDLIKNIKGIVEEGTTTNLAKATWIVYLSDIETIDEGDNFDDFYFLIDSKGGTPYQSEDLKITITNEVGDDSIIRCGDYSDSTSCNNDIGLNQVAGYSVSLNNPEIDCTDTDILCSCKWNFDDNECNPSWAVSFGSYGIGSCDYNENTPGETCEDGIQFLTYTWTGDWTWFIAPPEPSNSYDTLALCEGENTFPDESHNPCLTNLYEGKYRYDPLSKNVECKDGQNVVPCPARIQLSFFNTYNLIAVVILIVIIYYFLNFQKKPVKRKVAKKKSKGKK